MLYKRCMLPGRAIWLWTLGRLCRIPSVDRLLVLCLWFSYLLFDGCLSDRISWLMALNLSVEPC